MRRLTLSSPRVHATAKIPEIRCRRLAGSHPFIRRAVRLIAVAFRKAQDLIGFRVIAGTREREDVVNLDIITVVQHTLKIDALARIRVLAELLTVEPHLLEIGAAHVGVIRKTVERNEVFFHLLVTVLIGLIRCRDNRLLMLRALEILGHLDSNDVGHSIMPDNRIDHAAHLRGRAKHHRVRACRIEFEVGT